jgi:hypothetical protein
MTGYLARLAARASGSPAAATPRLPSRFEAGGAVDATAPATVETVVAAPRPAGAEPVAAATAPEPRMAPPRPRERFGTPDEIPTETTIVVDSSHARAAASTLPDSIAESTRADRPHGDEPRAVRPVAAVVLPAATAFTVASEQQRSDGAAEPDVVHVSIGRIDVRATVAAPVPEVRPRQPAPQRETLSLHDYLRGERAR